MKRLTPQDKLRKKIQSRISAFTVTDKKIANYLLEHPSEIPLISVQELARRLHAGPASIVRVANKLGYDGFRSLRAEFRKHLQESLAPLERFTLALNRGLDHSRLEIHRIARQDVQNINATLHLFDKAVFRKSVNMLCRARNIITLGVGMSNHLAEIAAFLLKRIGLRATALNQTGLKFTEELIAVDRRDVIIVFSLPPYSRESIEAAAFAREQTAGVIGFTNATTAPLAEHADTLLVAKTDTQLLTNSPSAMLVLLSALIAEVAATNRPRSTQAIKKILSMR